MQKKTIKQEDALVRLILYTGLSSYSTDPLNLGIIAPTSEGKTYPVIETMNLFPKQDVWYIGSMSTKTLVRQKGILVDKRNQQIGTLVKGLKRDIALLGNTKVERTKKFELTEQLNNLLEDSKDLIDLSGKTIVFLEPPNQELWNLIKPILSHDKDEIEFPFVDRNSAGSIYTKNVVVRGQPACIFCSARDESNWPQWPEVASRFLITSPNMVPKKYLESNILIAQRKGLPAFLQQSMIVSDEEISLAKECILYIKQLIKEAFRVWIPYTNILGEVLPAEKGTDNRAARRIFSLLGIIPLTKGQARPKLIYGEESLVVATLEDLNETLCITRNLSGIPSYKMKFYENILSPCFISNGAAAVSTRQLCEYYKKNTGKTINTDNLKKTYLKELLNNGIIEEEDSSEDHRQKLYRPLTLFDQARKQNYRNYSEFDNISHGCAIILPRYCRKIPKEWLFYEILALCNCRIGLDQITLLSPEDGKMCVREFVERYEKTDSLIRYFLQPRIREFHSNIFGDMKFLEGLGNNRNKKYKNLGNFLQFDNNSKEGSVEQTSGEEKMSSTSDNISINDEAKADTAVASNPLNEKPPARPKITDTKDFRQEEMEQ